MQPYVVAALDTLVPAAVLALAVWAAAWALVSRVPWAPAVRQTVRSVFNGPVVAGFLGYGLWAFLDRLAVVAPGSLPPYVHPADLELLIQLGVLWSAIAIAARATRRHSPKEHRSTRLLVYGIYAAGLLALVFVLLSSPEVPRVSGGIWAVLGFGTGLIATYLVIHIVNVVLERYLRAFTDRQPKLQTIYTFVRRLLLGVIAVIGVAISAYSSFPEATGALTSLLIAAGFLSIVIGLAAQQSISNVLAGALVSISQPFQIGDAVVFNNDFCFVEDIRLVFTVLRTWDNRRLMVPNSLFESQVVVNYTARDATMLAPLSLWITFDSDVDEAMRIMTDAAREHPDGRPIGNLPGTVIMQYDEYGVQLRLLSRAKDQPTAFQMTRDLLYTIRKRFDAAGIRLAVPVRRVQLEQIAPVGPADPRSPRPPPRKTSDP